MFILHVHSKPVQMVNYCQMSSSIAGGTATMRSLRNLEEMMQRASKVADSTFAWRVLKYAPSGASSNSSEATNDSARSGSDVSESEGSVGNCTWSDGGMVRAIRQDFKCKAGPAKPQSAFHGW